ncbi:hypothetical protein [Winogradskyella sp.]|uniref:hypothetical protein n=1 Tax=Winogradskyella sp. TaxID=1883156 RepID=UPI0026054A71|nr:hypothetical protein [Winogradskyella sp.]
MALRLKRTHKIGIFFLAVFVISFSLLELFEERFKEERWTTNPAQRYKMVDDLIESQLLMYKSKLEVRKILGEPSSSSNAEKDIFIYSIGDLPNFFNSRKEHLLIIFVNQSVDEVTLAFE